ncbi:MAG: hypothetical protein ACR2JF_09140 [Iamia sp.]
MSEKADFTDEYTSNDPRSYYANLGSLAYQVPEHGAAVFRHLAEAIEVADRPPTVLDVCCSYGINAALMNHDLSFDDLRRHYTSPEIAGLSRDELVAHDKTLLSQHRRDDTTRMLGLDISDEAVGYAVDVGLLDGGIVADLESDDAPASAVETMAQADLVTVTGGVGYVKERTFDQIVDASDGTPPWVAALTLRWIGFDAIAETLEGHGLVTERVEGYAVRQRRFADASERDHAFSELDARGLEPSEMEQDGWHCAELFVARPEEAVRGQSITDLMAGAVAQD